MSLKRTQKNQGIISLPLVLILGGLIVEIALVGVTLIYLLSVSNFGLRFSSEAFAGAQSGIDDATMRIVRGDFILPADVYNLPALGSAGVEVTITNAGVPADQLSITSVGSALGKERTLIAIVEVHPVTKAVKVLSLSEN